MVTRVTRVFRTGGVGAKWTFLMGGLGGTSAGVEVEAEVEMGGLAVEGGFVGLAFLAFLASLVFLVDLVDGEAGLAEVGDLDLDLEAGLEEIKG